MTKEGQEYRDKLCEMVSATGLYMLKHAHEIVDLAEMKVGFSINITYEYDEVPTIEIIQSHAMREVLEVLNGK